MSTQVATQSPGQLRDVRFLVAHVFDGAIVSRLRAGAKLAEHIVHGVDDRLWLIQLNRVT